MTPPLRLIEKIAVSRYSCSGCTRTIFVGERFYSPHGISQPTTPRYCPQCFHGSRS